MKLLRGPFLALTLVLTCGLLTTAFELPPDTVIAATRHSRETALDKLKQLAKEYSESTDMKRRKLS